MRAALFAFTGGGKVAARRIADALPDWDCRLYAPARLAGDGFAAYDGGLSECVRALFHLDALIFVGAAGIAVRAIAPHVTHKATDPAVLCADEGGRFVIPLLSGHIGGANRLARRLAAALGAEAVITTATDVNGRFSVDNWAAEQNMAVTSLALAKRVSAEILARDLPFCADALHPAELPDGLYWSDAGELGICVSTRDRHPFAQTLLIAPRALRVGLGCRRGISAEAVEGAIREVFEEYHLRMEAVAGAATIDLKSDEAGLIEACRNFGWPLAFYSAEELNAVSGDFSPSAFVKQTVGVDNVCERAASATGGRLIVPKTALNGATVAVAEQEWRLSFGEAAGGGHRARGL